MIKVLKHLAYVLVFSLIFAGGANLATAATKPAIKGATAKTITVGTSFNPKTKVTAVNSSGKSITKNIKITGKANTNKRGTYYYTYKVKVSSSKTLTVKRKITVKAKSYTFKKDSRQFDIKGGYGRGSVLKKGTKVSLYEKSSAGWYKTSKGKWIKSGFKGDYIYVGTKKKLYSKSSSTKTSKYAPYGIAKVLGTSKKHKKIQTKQGWISSPEFVDNYASVGEEDQQEVILKRMNKERKAAGKKALVLDETLSKIAIIRSKEMIDYKYFSHNSPNYGPFNNLIVQANYGYWGAGENIAAGGRSGEQYMTMWMNSSGHKANILNGNYDRVGIGVVKNPKTGFYSSVATQIFVSK